MRKIFSLKSVLVILIIAGIIFIISGISTYEDHSQRILNWIDARHNAVVNYSNEIEGVNYIMTGAAFIITGLYLIVRLKEKL